MIRLAALATFIAAAVGVSVTLGVTVLPRPKPVGDEIPSPVVYAPVTIPEVPEQPQSVKLEEIEDRLRAIQTKLSRIESKAEAAEGK